jgi:hypothetical protein
MSEESDKDLRKTQELFDFLQGIMPAGVKVPRGEIPGLTPAQAWAVVWYLGNQYWKVTDVVERCDVCGKLYHTHQSGGCLDYGKAPHIFCDNCVESDEYFRKQKCLKRNK